MEFSFTEMIVVGVIAFLVLGPEQLLKRAYQFGKFMAKMRSQFNNLRITAENEILERTEIEAIKKKIEEAGMFADTKAKSLESSIEENLLKLNKKI